MSEDPARVADLKYFAGPLVLVGAGKMGGALLEGWLRLGLDPNARRGAGAAAVGRNRRAGAARPAA